MVKNLYKSEIKTIVLLFVSFVLITFIFGGFLLNGLLRVPSQIANLLVVIAILLVTSKVYRREGKDISELGLNLKPGNFVFGLLGLMLGGLFVIPLIYLIAWMKGYPVIFNESFNSSYVLSGLWILFPTVMLEELAFRGICFKKTVEISGVTKANIIFSALFIVSHWLNVAQIGNPIEMTILLITGLGHVLYSTALLKSKTLFFPIGLHLGNNWVSLFVFSNLTIGDPVNGQLKPSLVNIVAPYTIPVLDKEFITTTLVTAFCFILFILAIRKWTPNKKLKLNSSPATV
ncbi:MAG TPA: CPBP family intramembrane glutamic endopeptidase [Flavitalea sp.]|nr:CPBP family intramembrane glutamic endopeptidase [Flavitalea sp.]